MLNMNSTTLNHHCTCITINKTGIMIEGASGTGKTSLALGVMEAAQNRGVEAKLVCDDQAMITARDNALWARVPESIVGKVELHGFGIVDVTHIEQCRIDLVCKLVDQDKITRLPQRRECTLLGVGIEYIEAPAQHEAQSIRLLLQKLSLPL